VKHCAKYQYLSAEIRICGQKRDVKSEVINRNAPEMSSSTEWCRMYSEICADSGAHALYDSS
jgi:hypothetical protein